VTPEPAPATPARWLNFWSSGPATRLALTVALVGLGLPLLLAWRWLGPPVSVPALSAERLLRQPSTLLVTIDARASAALPDAAAWPLESILRTTDPVQIPPQMRDKTLVLMCTGGIRSARAARHLRGLGASQTFSVRGGLQEWGTRSTLRPTGVRARQSPDGVEAGALFRPAPTYEQAVAVLAFFGVKLVYSTLAAILIVLLWRETAADLAALRRSMGAFFVGEGFCAVNVLVFGDHSLLLEHLHSAGMVASLALFFYALLDGVDARVIHFSDDARCAATSLCGACIKHAPVSCGLRRVFLVSIPLLALTAALPLFSAFRATAYVTRIFGFQYGYRHPIVHQVYELRYLPAVAITLLAVCCGLLLLFERRQVPRSKVLLSVALGATAFSYFRLLLVAAFVDDQVWFAAWEETSELMFVCLIAGALFLFPRLLPSAQVPLRAHDPEARA